jgi:UDP-galactopyranose mutase
MVHLSPRAHTASFADGSAVRYEHLISTLPLPRLVALAGDEAPPEIQQAARALRHVSVRCVNIGVGRPDVTDKHWIYYPEHTVFHRIFVQGNASPYCNPPGGFGFTCEITYSPSKPLPCEGDELIRRCIDDAISVGFIRADDPIWAANQVDLPIAYVVYDHDRAENVERIRTWLAGYDIVLAGRYSEWEYYNSDHAFIAGMKAAQAVQAVEDTTLAADAG